MALVQGADELTAGNVCAGIVEVSRAENEQIPELAQADRPASSTPETLRWSFTENTETRDFASTSFTVNDGLISMLDDGQIPQQLLSEQLSRYLDGGEADLRRNLESLLNQLQSQARGMAGRQEVVAGWEDEAADVSYLDTRTQYRDPASYPPIPFALTDSEDMSSLPVTCTFGTMRDGNLSFVSQDFRWFEASHFFDALNSQAEASVGMMFLTITNWQPWFLANLKRAVPTFPVQSVLHLSDNSPVTMLPSVDRYLSEISCMTEHVDLAMDGDRETQNGLNIGSNRTKSRPFAVWTSARDALPHHSQRPLVVVATKSSENVVSKIAGHYVQAKNGQVSHVRWERMRANQTWVYLDLYNLFTKWDNVWEAVKSNVNANLAQIHSNTRTITVKERTKQLHFGNNVMITLRECLRAHKASLKIVIQRNSESSEQQYWQSSEILSVRLDDALQLLEYYDQMASSLLEQQHNLLSLSSTLENVSQSQAIASLNSLAVVFLPLSLVASIFGFNTITVSPKLFPAAAIPALVLTIGIAWIANKLMSSDQHFLSESRNTRPSDIEKLPIHRSVSTFNYPDVQRGESPWYLPRNLLRLIIPTQTPSRSPFRQSPPDRPAPSPYVATNHGRLRTSYQSTQVSPSPYILRRGPNSESAQSSGNSLPRLPHLPIINPLWPPTTFSLFDQSGPSTAATPNRSPLHPSSASSQGNTSTRQLSPNVVIRNSPTHSSTHEAPPDMLRSPTVVEPSELAIPPAIPLRHPRSHVAFQLAAGTQRESQILQVPQRNAERKSMRARSEGDLVQSMIMARGMGDITDAEEDSEMGTERTSSEISSNGQIDYSEIARRQAEAFGFGIGFVSASGATSDNTSARSTQLTSRSPEPNQPEVGVQIFSFGDQQIVMEALQTSALSIGPGYVERLVSRFEAGDTARKSPGTPGTGHSSPLVEHETHGIEHEVRGLGIFDPEEYEREDDTQAHNELYDVEEEKFRPPRSPGHIESSNSMGEKRRQSILETPIPIPPRHSSQFDLVSDLPRPRNLASRKNSPEQPITPSIVKLASGQGLLRRTASASSNETAVTAHTRPMSLSASIPSHSQQVLEIYDSDGFYASPTTIRPDRMGEHAEHPGGLRERDVLGLMDNESDVRSSWAASETWRRMREEEEEAEVEEEARRGAEVLRVEDIRRTEAANVLVADTENRSRSGSRSGGSRSGTDGERSSSEVETSDAYDEDDSEDSGLGTLVDVERVTRMLVNVGLGASVGNRASVASGGSYSMGFLDTIPE